MIRCLHVRNLAIIKEATLDLGPGLNLLTGETGAGKSILVDALMLGLGARAETDLVRSGSEKCSVEIEFDLSDNRPALAFLEDKGYVTEGGAVVVHRDVSGGRSRGFIGGTLAPAADLRALAALCVAVHGQHQHQTLLDPSRHRELLDRRAALGDGLEAMGRAAAELALATARLHSMRDGAQRIAQRIDALRCQVEEIDAAQVRPQERAALRSERELLRHAEAVLGHCRGAVEALYDGDGAAVARLAEGLRAAREVVRFEPGLAEELARGGAAGAGIEELAFRVGGFAPRLNPGPPPPGRGQRR